MSMPITLPALGESVSEATITRWLKKVGESVEAGEAIVEVSTDKVDTEVSATSSGTLESIAVPEGETVAVGTVLAVIETSEDAAVPNASQDGPTPLPPATPHSPTVTASETPAVNTFLSPLVRALVREHGTDIATIQGSGLGGRIRKADVLAVVSQVANGSGSSENEASDPHATLASASRGDIIPMTRLRRTIAERAVQSLVTSAQLTTVIEVDVTAIDTLRKKERDSFAQRTGVKLTLLPFFAVAATRALREFPIINSRIDGDTIVLPGREHVNIAVDTEKGLYNPVIKNASDLDVEGFARAIHSVASRARTGELGADDLTGGTFTITNTGSRGALFDTPIVFLPQVAILGVGVVTRRPVVVSDGLNEGIGIRSMVHVALSYDHRVIDGADASRYLTALKDHLESGNFTV